MKNTEALPLELRVFVGNVKQRLFRAERKKVWAFLHMRRIFHSARHPARWRFDFVEAHLLAEMGSGVGRGGAQSCVWIAMDFHMEEVS